MKKNRNPERTKTLKEKGKIPFRYRFFLGGASFFLALMILVTGVAFAFRETIDLYLSGSRTNVSKEAKEEAAYNSRRLAAQIEAEGAVLLKNENNTLSMVGLMFGIRFGCGIARRLRAELWGGIILVIIGTKILVEHLFF